MTDLAALTADQLAEKVREEALARFWPKVQQLSDYECWQWLAARDTKGYGVFRLDGRQTSAHRAAYRLLVGPIPDGKQIDHLCRNHGCVNPYHMELVTPRENTLRGVGPTAANATKTHCKNGHLLAGANLGKVSRRHERCCLTCARERMRAKARQS